MYLINNFRKEKKIPHVSLPKHPKWREEITRYEVTRKTISVPHNTDHQVITVAREVSEDSVDNNFLSSVANVTLSDEGAKPATKNWTCVASYMEVTHKLKRHSSLAPGHSRFVSIEDREEERGTSSHRRSKSVHTGRRSRMEGGCSFKGDYCNQPVEQI
jgi:hypothetical protein